MILLRWQNIIHDDMREKGGRRGEENKRKVKVRKVKD